MNTPQVVMLAVGALLLALTALTRSRASAGRLGGSEGQERLVVVGLPCLGAVLVLAGLLPALPGGARGAVAGVAVLLCLVVLGWGAFGLPLPRWAVPAHRRASRDGRRPTEAARRRARRAVRRG